MSTSLLNRAFGRAISSSLHRQPLICRHISRNVTPLRAFTRLPPSPTLKFVEIKSWPRTRFFSSTPFQRGPRPYPHRPSSFNQPPKRQFLGFLNTIPENSIFYSILAINGLVFVMWYMSSERMVCVLFYSPLKNSPIRLAETRTKSNVIHMDEK
jgi:hypothetical protein